jgi:Calcineurin-like phosphoesterase/Beta-lactamase enzyme family
VTDAPTGSTRSFRGAGWACEKPGRYRELREEARRLDPGTTRASAEPGDDQFRWNLVTMREARNEKLAAFHDPSDDQRRAWVAHLRAQGNRDLVVRPPGLEERASFLVVGDPGEGDSSQFALVEPLKARADGTDFIFVASDVVYPAGDVNDYRRKFYFPYRDLPQPVYAIPGNHDWDDGGLYGFMFHFCGQADPPRGVLEAVPRPLRALWRKPSAIQVETREARREREAAGGLPEQPGSYFAIATGPLLVVGLDLGLSGRVDRDQGAWFHSLSREDPRPKLLVTSKPIYGDGHYTPTAIEGGGTIDDVIRDPATNYVAVVSGEIHNYQRYPVAVEGGRTVQYIVCGAGGAFTQGTHTVGRIEIPNPNPRTAAGRRGQRPPLSVARRLALLLQRDVRAPGRGVDAAGRPPWARPSANPDGRRAPRRDGDSRASRPRREGNGGPPRRRAATGRRRRASARGRGRAGGRAPRTLAPVRPARGALLPVLGLGRAAVLQVLPARRRDAGGDPDPLLRGDGLRRARRGSPARGRGRLDTGGGMVGRGLIAACAAAACAWSSPAVAQAPAGPSWDANVRAAIRYAEGRAGAESFAVIDERGRLRGRLAARVFPSASVLKAMLLVAYLNRPDVRGRALTRDERALLEPMIRWSANAPASYLVRLMGPEPLDRLARRAGMRYFRLSSPWGRSEIAAGDQARFFRRIDRLVPARHRPYARRLLLTVIQAQRWGIPPAAPAGWRILFKGGWGSGTGWVTHQAALLERGDRRVSVAILTRANPSHAHGTETIRGIAQRLLRGLR